MCQIPQGFPLTGNSREAESSGSEPRSEGLTVLHLGAQFALFGVLEERLMLGLPGRAGLVAAGLIEQRSVPARRRAGKQTSSAPKAAAAGQRHPSPPAQT